MKSLSRLLLAQGMRMHVPKQFGGVGRFLKGESAAGHTECCMCVVTQHMHGMGHDITSIEQKAYQ